MICFNHPILRFWFVHFKGRYSVRSFFWLEWGGCIVGDAVWGIVLGSPLQVLVYPATEMTRLLLSHTSEELLCGAPGTRHPDFSRERVGAKRRSFRQGWTYAGECRSDQEFHTLLF